MKKISFKKKAQDHTVVWQFLHTLFKGMKGQHPEDYKSNLALLKEYERQNYRPNDNALMRFTDQLKGKESRAWAAFYLDYRTKRGLYASEKRTASYTINKKDLLTFLKSPQFKKNGRKILEEVQKEVYVAALFELNEAYLDSAINRFAPVEGEFQSAFNRLFRLGNNDWTNDLAEDYHKTSDAFLEWVDSTKAATYLDDYIEIDMALFLDSMHKSQMLEKFVGRFDFRKAMKASQEYKNIAVYGYLKRGKMAKTIPMRRTAGEVRFVKDNSNDASSWAWKQGPSERNMQPDYNYNPKRKKALAKVLRSTTASMGHAMSAYNAFTKIKSADVSPDGNLGGKGYIQKIMDMRKQYMNVVEALSALSDTIYDEINAPHWAAISRQESEEDKKEVAQIIQDAEEIKEDPEGWAEDQEDTMDEDHTPMGKTASSKSIPTKYLRGDK